MTRKNNYPLSQTDELAGWIYQFFDLEPEEVVEAGRYEEKIAFTTGSGLWQFTVGLCNAPVTFERLKETVLKGLS